MIITIDGYSVTGKTTAASLLAKDLDFIHINSGLIFRLITWKALQKGINLTSLQDRKKEIMLILDTLEANVGQNAPFFSELKSYDVVAFGTELAKLGFVRDKVFNLMHQYAQQQDIIVEGRDIGTAIFPNAEHKFFFVSDLDMRVLRITTETQRADTDNIRLEIKRRDQEDETRKISPLRRPANSIEIDTTHLTIEKTVQVLKGYLQ